jgi:hypothetical protein
MLPKHYQNRLTNEKALLSIASQLRHDILHLTGSISIVPSRTLTAGPMWLLAAI